MSNKWLALAPINNTFWLRDLDFPILFEQSVKIDNIPDWVKNHENLKHLGTIDSEMIRKAKHAFLVSYEADSIGSAQTQTEQEISLANIASWITKPNGLGFFAMLHFDEIEQEPQLRQYHISRRFRAHKDYSRTSLDRDDFKRALTFHKKLSKLNSETTVWRAVFALWLGLRESDWASRYMQFWICLEALFGPAEPQETTFRTSQRIALFLENDSQKASDLFHKVKKSYSWRSKIVHGHKHAKIKPAESVAQSLFVERLVASALFRILDEENLVATFNAKTREKYLEDLVFQK